MTHVKLQKKTAVILRDFTPNGWWIQHTVI